MGLLTEVDAHCLQNSAANNNGCHNNRSLASRNRNSRCYRHAHLQGACHSWNVDNGCSRSSESLVPVASGKREQEERDAVFRFLSSKMDAAYSSETSVAPVHVPRPQPELTVLGFTVDCLQQIISDGIKSSLADEFKPKGNSVQNGKFRQTIFFGWGVGVTPLDRNTSATRVF